MRDCLAATLAGSPRVELREPREQPPNQLNQITLYLVRDHFQDVRQMLPFGR